MFLLDTNIVSELRRPKPHGAVVAWVKQAPVGQLHLSAVTLGEIQDGIEATRQRDGKKAAEIERWLNDVEASYEIIPMSGRVFRRWAQLRWTHPNAAIEDSMIAATALVHELIVVTRNTKDFKIPGIRIFDPFKYAER
jgi:predicted nucleic acid-binding protein